MKYAPPDTRVELDWTLVEGVVRIAVSDEGPGIPPEWREQIFEPYARRETHDGAGVRHRALRGAAAGGIHEGTTVVRARTRRRRALRARAPAAVAA